MTPTYETPLQGQLYEDAEGRVHIAHYESDEEVATVHNGYCVRCRVPDVARSSGFVCKTCIADAWEKAESWGGTKDEVGVRVQSMLTQWRVGKL